MLYECNIKLRFGSVNTVVPLSIYRKGWDKHVKIVGDRSRKGFPIYHIWLDVPGVFWLHEVFKPFLRNHKSTKG